MQGRENSGRPNKVQAAAAKYACGVVLFFLKLNFRGAAVHGGPEGYRQGADLRYGVHGFCIALCIGHDQRPGRLIGRPVAGADLGDGLPGQTGLKVQGQRKGFAWLQQQVVGVGSAEVFVVGFDSDGLPVAGDLVFQGVLVFLAGGKTQTEKQKGGKGEN